MNTYTIHLSSNTSNYSQTLSTSHFDDNTRLELILGDLFNESIPLYIMFDWGDGNSETIDNSIEFDRLAPKVFITNDLFDTTHSHEYYPSATSLYKNLSAQVLISYMDGEFSNFIIPIQIRTYDYFESIYDMHLEHTNILPYEYNPKEHYFSTEKNGYLIELRGN